MAKLLCTFSHHHDSDKTPWKAFVASEAEALEQAVLEEFGVVLREPAEEVLERAKKAGPEGTAARTCCPGDEGEGEDYDADTVIVWWEEHPENRGAKANWGAGVGETLEGTDKRESVWLEVNDWEPPAKERAELEALPKEELVQRLLEAAALR